MEKKIEFTEFRCTACGAIMDEVKTLDGVTHRFLCSECGGEGRIRPLEPSTKRDE